MICNISSPCCGEDYLKKFLKKLLPSDTYEDSIGNLIVHKKGSGKKIVLCCGIDEDSFVVTSINNGKIYFKHLGNKSIFPGTTVNINGIEGYVCCEDDKQPLKEQYISLIDKTEVELGSVGSISSEYFEDEDYIKGSRIGRALVIDKLICLANSYSGENDLYIVFAVQSLFNFKGSVNVSNLVESDLFVSFEEIESESDKLVLYKATKGYVLSQANEEFFEKCDLKTEVDTKKQTFATFCKKSNVAVLGIPVRFLKFPSQVVGKSIDKNIDNILNTIL